MWQNKIKIGDLGVMNAWFFIKSFHKLNVSGTKDVKTIMPIHVLLKSRGTDTAKKYKWSCGSLVLYY